MFIQRAPTYVYSLPCGHRFRTLTRAELVDGKYWFPCHCGQCWGLWPSQLCEGRPCGPSGNKLSDGQVARRIDTTILMDRVASFYLRAWDGDMTGRQVAAYLGVSYNVVYPVAAELGRYIDE